MKLLQLIKVILACILYFAFSDLSFALSENTTKPWHIISDNATYNFKTGIAIYSGNAKVFQDTMQLWGKIITIYYTTHSQSIEKIIALGSLAHFTILDTKPADTIYAEAERIEYDLSSKKLLLIGKAKVMQNNNTMAGPRIEYDAIQKIATSLSSKNNQTVITINPKTEHIK